jgi:hypothetical protein
MILEKLKMNELKTIEPQILTLRGQRVMLDSDLAEIYGVTTTRLNEQENEMWTVSQKISCSG